MAYNILFVIFCFFGFVTLYRAGYYLACSHSNNYGINMHSKQRGC